MTYRACLVAVLTILAAVDVRCRPQKAEIRLRNLARTSDLIELQCSIEGKIDDFRRAMGLTLFKVGSLEDLAYAYPNSEAEGPNNRTSVKGQLSGTSGYLSVLIAEIDEEDEGEYTCIFEYKDRSNKAQELNSTINITYEPTMAAVTAFNSCDCDAFQDAITIIRGEINGLTEKNKQLTSRIERLESKGPTVHVGTGLETIDDTCRVSFTARFETRKGYVILGEQTAQFDSVVSNKGDAYDTTTGTFTAPCNGQYFFSVTLRSHQDLDSGYVDGVIQVDGVEKARTSVYINAPIENYQSATNGVVLTLEKGQKVNVLIKTTSSGEFVGEGYSTFSGFYISP
ncbi:uncharacterized protein LOC131929392 [Physella acuta]|uniref:uncharacterized protein LOC131929392 n=1 Tax=Physella acuta TaxID=109671 RepID=UPI0027DD7A55|nr:uncharacterized protein LOC131929392 [Physella acuta]